jgi:hypothetical protein
MVLVGETRMEGKNDFLAKAVCLFMNMDKNGRRSIRAGAGADEIVVEAAPKK